MFCNLLSKFFAAVSATCSHFGSVRLSERAILRSLLDRGTTNVPTQFCQSMPSDGQPKTWGQRKYNLCPLKLFDQIAGPLADADIAYIFVRGPRNPPAIQRATQFGKAN